MNKFLIAFWFMCGCSGIAFAGSPTIYQILADEGKLTGFRLQGTPGIITALHGVVGKENIRAISSTDYKPHLNLKIVSVDVARDLAVLANKELGDAAVDGLTQAKEPSWEAGEKLTIIGYPKEIVLEELKTVVELRNPPQKALKTLVGAEKLLALRERGSPDPELAVASIQGELLPGHSGAPILNSKQQVIAVGNGGLFDEISWGIPLAEIKWTPFEKLDKATLDRLNKRSGLFAEIQVLGSPITLAEVEDKDGSTTAKASGKVSWLPKNKGIRIDTHLYVRKSGVKGKGYAFARVDLLDAAGNTVWSSPVREKHKGASAFKGVAEGEEDFQETAPAELRSTVTSAVLIVRANDSDGLTVDLEKFFETVGGEIQKSVSEGKGLRKFEKLFAL